MTGEPLDVAVRAWAVPDRTRDYTGPRRRHKPAALVVFDTETELGGPQDLIVACYRYVRVSWSGPVPKLTTIEEGLVVPDDLEERDPHAFALVAAYALDYQPSVDLNVRDVTRRLVVLTRHQFCERMLWQACWRNRATLVGFNLAFDISRLRLSWHEGRGHHRGAFVLRLWEYQGGDHRYRPNVVARRLDNKRTLFSWSGVLDPPNDGAPHSSKDNHFLDLRTLCFALTNGSHSLESACRAFDIRYLKREVELGMLSEELIDYVRDDVGATTLLAEAALKVFHQHPVALSADRTYSAAAIGAAYLRRIGIRPPRTHAEISNAQLAQAMAAFYGPRVEVRIRHVPVPVSLVDFSSQYAHVARLLGLWDLLRAERLAAVDATEEVNALLERCALDDLFDASFWRGLVGVASVLPDGDHLPTRAWFAGPGDVPRVGVGPLASDRAMWFSLPDLVAAKILAGRVPRVVSAWRIVGDGRRLGLRAVRLGGKVRFDPYRADWWQTLIKARSELGKSMLADGLKCVANGTAYGNWIRLDQQPRPDKVTLYGCDGSESRQACERPEQPFEWTFPPFASALTAGGRLLMAALERELIDRGGCFASANTDSATVVSTRTGGLVACPGGRERPEVGSEAVRAIPWSEVEEIQRDFGGLGVPLNLTQENFVYGDRRELSAVCVAGSRVILYREDPRGRRHVVKRSEVALGDLRSPFGRGTSKRFVDAAAAWMLDWILDGPSLEPSWFSTPATVDVSMGTPRRVGSLGASGSPFGFAMSARRAQRADPPLAGDRVRLMTSAGADAEVATWSNVSSGQEERVSARGQRPQPGDVHMATYGEEIVKLLLHPEHKMIDPDGQPSKAMTTGYLRPRPVHVRIVRLIGKEGNRLDEIKTGELLDPDEIIIEYGSDFWEHLLVPAGRAFGIRRLSRLAGVSLSQLMELLSLRATPRPDTRARLMAALEQHLFPVIDDTQSPPSHTASAKPSFNANYPSRILPPELD